MSDRSQSTDRRTSGCARSAGGTIRTGIRRVACNRSIIDRPAMPGVLYVVATPIGNLEDITLRARRVLGEVALIAAEDTRRTSKLLAHLQIRTPMMSLREHNEARETPRIIERLLAGDGVALVSDAGTPGIADPGARVVHAAHAHNIRVIPIPGPSAVAAALSICG